MVNVFSEIIVSEAYYFIQNIMTPEVSLTVLKNFNDNVLFISATASIFTKIIICSDE